VGRVAPLDFNTWYCREKLNETLFSVLFFPLPPLPLEIFLPMPFDSTDDFFELFACFYKDDLFGYSLSLKFLFFSVTEFLPEN